MKPRHLSEGLLSENKHPGSGNCWTDNISETLVRLVYRIMYFGLRLLLSVPFSSFTLSDSLLRLSLSQPITHSRNFSNFRCRKVKDETTGEGTPFQPKVGHPLSLQLILDFFTQAYSLFAQRGVKGFQACVGGLSTSRLNSPVRGRAPWFMERLLRLSRD
ncbi:hypothetical protein PIB30_057251 [Stylosanthes scabra]|uniref:Uncharacterized protein n=1 Tax=Stylosanthes scabra TaxID=79078 RepID=A0ABU6UK28_9FABA|nr:hypothetical protein [Stylosanthes scabra]